MKLRLRPFLAGFLAAAALCAAGDAATPQPPAPGTAGPAQQPPAPQQQEIEDFVPTERLSADEAVSFPTDI